MEEETQNGPVVEQVQEIGESGPVASPITSQEQPQPQGYQPELFREEGEINVNTGDVLPYIEEETDATWGDAFNVNNPFFGVKHQTGLNSYNPTTPTWDPEETDWVKELSPEDRLAISQANSEEYAYEIIARRDLYQHSSEQLAGEGLPTQLGMGLVAASADPFIIAPIGVTATATKAAFTLAAKATRLAALSAESAAVGMAAASTSVFTERAIGINDDTSYGTANLYAGLFSGGLPVVGSWLSGGYSSAKIAKSLTKDPKNFGLVFGETVLESVGGTQLRTPFTNFLNKMGLSSDVTFTASSNNQMVTLVSNRMDAPPIAVLDRNTGEPVPISTTGQNHKAKFHGMQRNYMSKVKGLYTQSTYKNEEAFNIEVGKVNRARAVEQENLTYTELNDHIEFTKSQAKMAKNAERDAYINEDLAYYKGEDGKDVILAPEELRQAEADRAADDAYKAEVDEYNKQVESLAAEEDAYIKTTLAEQKLTGMSNKDLKEVEAALREQIANSNKNVLPLEPIKPTRQFPYDIKTKKRTDKDIKQYDEQLELQMKEQIEASINAKKDELYAKHQVDFKHADPKVVEAAKVATDFYDNVRQTGQKLKVHEMMGLRGDKHYMTRIFDFQKVRAMDMPDLVKMLEVGLKGHAAQVGVAADKILEAATEMATKLKKLDYTRDYADYSFFVPKEMAASSFNKSKKFKLNDSMIEDILVTNIEDVVGQYSYSQAGSFAAHHAFPEIAGIPRGEQISKFKEVFVDPIVQSGASAKEVNALNNMFEDMLGTFRIAKNSDSAVWKGTRIMNSINSITYGGSFQLNNVAELGGMLLDGHVKNVMKTRLGSLKEIGTMFTGKGIEDPLVRDFVLMGQFENLFETNSMMKMSDTEAVFNVNKVEHNINKGTSEFFKYTGLRAGTVALEAIAGPKVIHDIMDFGNMATLSRSKKKYLARIGLSHDDAKSIHNLLQEVGEFDSKGKIYDMHLEKWDDVHLDKMTTAVGNGIKQLVIKGDTTYLPSFVLKPNAFSRLFFQFLRYPLAATETLMARGLDENPARWLAGTMTSTFMMGMVLYGREQAAIQAGLVNEADAKYANFWDDEGAAMKLFTSGLSKAGTLGGSEVFLSKILAVSGVPMPGSEYASKDPLSAIMGPTFSRVPQIMNVLQPIFTEGRIDDRQQWNSFKAMAPGGTAPFVSEYLASQIKEYTY